MGPDSDSTYAATYETLKPVLMAPDTASVGGYGKPGTVSPPIGGTSGKSATVKGANSITAPNICIEDGRIEFVKSPVDSGDEKQDYLKVSRAQRALTCPLFCYKCSEIEIFAVS